MVKTGYKYTKQQPNKGKTNMLKRSAASSKPGRIAPKKNDLNMRSPQLIARLKMYNNGKAIRNKEGKVVGGQYMMGDRAGDRDITAATGRIAPDRRWFGNTRVVGAAELDRFREEMTDKMADPYSVVVKRKKLPMGLLRDAAEMNASKKGLNAGLLANEPFEHAFGRKSRRKRVKIEQLLVGRTSKIDEGGDVEVRVEGAAEPASKKDTKKGSDNRKAELEKYEEAKAFMPFGGGAAEPVARMPTDDASGYGALLAAAQTSADTYDKVNTREGIVPWGRDKDVEATEGEGVDWVREKKDDIFMKGQSKRIWGEFYKVVDCSDVILHVIDARDVPGTRCLMIEKHIAKNCPHKHLVFVLNKIDLVPNWVAKRWIGELSQVRPTIAFHASMTHAFGKGAMISLLRQFSKLHEDKKQISVGVIGYPNVGKSSVINTLISKKSCNVAPIPGETKIWQYITLFRNIYLIDCPGVVVDSAGDTETDSVLKGVVRAERLENPEDFIDAIQSQVKREHIAAMYGLPKSGVGTWKDSLDLMEKIALKCGRLRKGGEPCLRSASIYIINDFQRGRLPHYVNPPELTEGEGDSKPAVAVQVEGIKLDKQNLDVIEGSAGSAMDMDEEEPNKKKAATKKGKASSNKDDDREDDDDDDNDSASDEEETTEPLAVVGGGDWD